MKLFMLQLITSSVSVVGDFFVLQTLFSVEKSRVRILWQHVFIILIYKLFILFVNV